MVRPQQVHPAEDGDSDLNVRFMLPRGSGEREEECRERVSWVEEPGSCLLLHSADIGRKVIQLFISVKRVEG